MYKRSRFTKLALFLLVVGCLLAFASDSWSCPTCKDGISDGGNSANLVRGYFWSIVFMMSMPFLILGGLSTYLYLEVRKAKRVREIHAPVNADGAFAGRGETAGV